MSRPPRISTVEVVGLVTAFASAPNLKGDKNTISANGADKAKNSHSEVARLRGRQRCSAERRQPPRRLPPSASDVLGQTKGTDDSDKGRTAWGRSPCRRSRPPARARLPEIPRSCPWRGAPRRNNRPRTAERSTARQS